MTTIDLNPDSQHNPERTQTLADVVGEAIRCLNHGTVPYRGALRYPSDVYLLLGSLRHAIGLMPQLFEQLGEWLAECQAKGAIHDDRGTDSDAAVATALESLHAAGTAANNLHTTLAPAHNATGHLAYN